MFSRRNKLIYLGLSFSQTSLVIILDAAMSNGHSFHPSTAVTAVLSLCCVFVKDIVPFGNPVKYMAKKSVYAIKTLFVLTRFLLILWHHVATVTSKEKIRTGKFIFFWKQKHFISLFLMQHLTLWSRVTCIIWSLIYLLFFVCIHMVECTYCKSLWIKVSAK